MAALGSIIAHCGNLFSAKRVEKQHCGKAEPWKGQRWRLQGGGKSSIRQAAGCQMNISRENTCPPNINTKSTSFISVLISSKLNSKDCILRPWICIHYFSCHTAKIPDTSNLKKDRDLAHSLRVRSIMAAHAWQQEQQTGTRKTKTHLLVLILP